MRRYFIVLLLCAASAFAQNKQPIGPPAEAAHGDTCDITTNPQTCTFYVPSEIQRLKLENAQLKLALIGAQIQPLQAKWQEQMAVLGQLCEAVRKENKWPENVKCDAGTLKFAEAAQPRPAGQPGRQPVPAPPGTEPAKP